MPSLVLGNTAPIETRKVDEARDEVVRISRPDLGNTTTGFGLADHLSLANMLTLVSSVYASHHSDEPPAWVESDDEGLAAAVARELGCPIGRPKDWVEGSQDGAEEATDPSLHTLLVSSEDDSDD